jgi:hypothetical protein
VQSEQINELAKALCLAQAEIEGATKDSENPFHKSKYADLYTCWKCCRDQLTRNGLSVVQTMDYESDRSFLVTTLLHTSGQWIRGKLVIPQVKPGPQELGSCITYCRRYSLSAMVGLSQYDDDGEDAMKSLREKQPKQEIKPNSPKTELQKKVCAGGVITSIDEIDGFLEHLVKKYSTPAKPMDIDYFISKALASDENTIKFIDELKNFLNKSIS